MSTPDAETELRRLLLAGLDGDEATLWLVEWPERGGQALPAPDLRIDLAQAGTGREAGLEAGTATGRAWLEALRKKAGLQPLSAG